jgi:N-acetylmuramic acid 6-phosphate etherase
VDRSYNLEMRSRTRTRGRAKFRLKEHPLTEQRNPASKNLDRMTALEIVRLMNREDRKVAIAVEREIPAIARAVDGIVGRIEKGGRLIYVGAGSSGRIAVLDASEWPPTFGTSPELVKALIAGGARAIVQSVEGAEDRTQDAVRDLEKIRLTANDATVGIAASGTTPYVIAAIRYAKKKGALTIGVTSNKRSPLAKTTKIAITPMVGPEVLTGSTRLKAGTSQKMVLNMLSTATMVRLGRAYDNLMIDLGQTNTKLRERAKRILEQASGKGMYAVAHAVRQSDHDLRLALVMLKKKVSAAEARKDLAKAGGILRKALDE